MTQEPDGQATTEGKRRIWRFLPLVLVLAGLAAFFATGSQRYLRLEALADNRDRLQDFVAAHRIEAVLLYMLVYVGAVTLSVPGGAVLTMIGGFLFGWLAGGALAAVSATMGAVGVYFVARTSIGDALLHRLYLDAAGISVLDMWPDGGVAVRSVNDTAHLPVR